MKPEDEKPAEDQSANTNNDGDISSAPADALSRTPDDLEQEQVAAEAETKASQEAVPVKKLSPFKKFFRKANLYFLLFLMVVAIGIVITVVNYINSKNVPPPPAIANQELTEEALRQLANTDASVGDTNQTLTIKGNAVIEGQTLMRGSLNVAGDIQAGGALRAPSITISGTSNLGTAQIDSLQVAGNTAIQGNTTLRDLSVAGASTFSGAMTASQITVTRLIMSGNASLEVPNHISFTGPTPNRSINGAQLGTGGTASVSGSDTSGVVNISIGNNPAAGCMVRIAFNQQFPRQPRVNITPIGSAAGRTQYYVDRDQSGFSICTAIPAPANQSFAFDYFVAY